MTSSKFKYIRMQLLGSLLLLILFGIMFFVTSLLCIIMSIHHITMAVYPVITALSCVIFYLLGKKYIRKFVGRVTFFEVTCLYCSLTVAECFFWISLWFRFFQRLYYLVY